MSVFSGAADVEPFLHTIAEHLVPMQLSTEDVTNFTSRVRSARLGDIRLLNVWTRDAFTARRTRKLIAGSSEPHFLKVGVQRRGAALVSQAGRLCTVAEGDFMLYDTTRPYEISSGPGSHIQSVLLPLDLLALPPKHLQELTAQPISGRGGSGSMLTRFMAGLPAHLDPTSGSAHWHLADAAISLLNASLVEQLAKAGVTHFDGNKASLLIQINAHIERRLGDPELTVDSIAAAHHISRRSLQKLFEQHQMTVTGWIRHRRLEHCRRDLADPALQAFSVHAIAARWGFFRPAHFSRLFKSTYGLSPLQYRADSRRAAR